MNGIMTKNSVLKGTTQGSWLQGLSAYDIAIRMGFKGNVYQWLDSLKGFSPLVSDCQEVEGGINLTITDDAGEHIIFIPKGREIELICDTNGIIWWRYKDDVQAEQLIDLNTFTDNKFNEAINDLQFVQIVDDLPDPLEASDQVIYILREED